MVPVFTFLAFLFLGEVVLPQDKGAVRDTTVSQTALLQKIKADFEALTEHDKQVHKAMDELSTMFKAYSLIKDTVITMPKEFFNRPQEK